MLINVFNDYCHIFQPSAMMCKAPQQNWVNFSEVIPDTYRHQRMKYPERKICRMTYIVCCWKPYIPQAPCDDLRWSSSPGVHQNTDTQCVTMVWSWSVWVVTLIPLGACVCVASASLAQLAEWETAHSLLPPSRDVLWCILLSGFSFSICSHVFNYLLKMLLCKAGLFHFRCSLPPT